MKLKLADTLFNAMAVVHMIGETQAMFGKGVSTSDIAAFMGVTKPTALTRLQAMKDKGFVLCEINPYRNNSVSFKWSLSDVTFAKYQVGAYEAFYRDIAVKRIQSAQKHPLHKAIFV